jgi:spoIIIJ-associated protein
MENNIYTPLTTDELSVVQTLVDDLFATLDISGSATVEEQNEMIHVVLDTEDGGMVIGYHGETLEALQLVLSLMVAKKLGRFIRVSVEVGDYKKNRQEYLEKLASQTRERVVGEQREVVLSDLKSWERRVIHMILQNDEEVESESMGEGKDRVLVIRPRV